jgi:hypothetical protein
MIKYIK